MILGVRLFDEILLHEFQVFVLIPQQVVLKLYNSRLIYLILCLISLISGGLDKMSKITKFKILKFDGKYFAT